MKKDIVRIILGIVMIVLPILICTGCNSWIRESVEIALSNPTVATVSTIKPTVTPAATPSTHTHTFGDWIIKKEATCTEKGKKERSCACGEKESKSIDMKDHRVVVDKAVKATCTTTGLSEGKHCSVCNTILIAQQKTPFAAHTYDDKYDATCNICGQKRDADCAHNRTEVIKGRAATCTAPGLTDGKKCSICGETIVAQQTIPQRSHTYSTWTTVSDATCSHEGIKERYCSACGHTDTSYIPATDNHSYVNGSCTFCGETLPSTSGIVYVLSSDETYYICKGFTSISKKFNVTSAVVAAYYQGKPVKHIAFDAFSHCPKLKSVILPDTITYINSSAFYGSESLSSIHIPSSVKSIGMFAFNDCYSLTDIYYDGTKAQWDAIDKEGGWNQDTGNYTIHCTDGDITRG